MRDFPQPAAVSSPTHSPSLPPPLKRWQFPWPLAIALACGCALACVAFDTTGERTAPERPVSPTRTSPLGMKHLGELEPISLNRFLDDKKDEKPDEKKKVAAPELDGGIAWLNTGGPLSLKKDLKGKFVLLDFWTLCCINCIHILPDLAKLEKKYANELVVIGVHSPKFDNEKETASIRKAILRYQIEHPVVNDADHKIWDRYEISAWPTWVLIDPEGNVVGYTEGEGNFELLDIILTKMIEDHKKNKTLNEKPIRFDLAKFREGGDTPLYFPGKVVADEKGKRLFIADSTHHRIVITDLDGKMLAVAGSGTPGNVDGAFDKAQFDDPQGMAFNGDLLYVADRKNHTIRQLDLKTNRVTTIAGTGEQADPDNRRPARPMPATEFGLNSPWDLHLDGNQLYIAMAGHHQIWLLDLKEKTVMLFAGSGRENIGDGALQKAMFAQPSGLTSDGKYLYVADCEVSALRRVPFDPEGQVETLVGRGLFVFGDVDGPGQIPDDPLGLKGEARIQHALGVVYVDGKLYVADTYNSKIKVFDLKKGELTTLVGGNPIGWAGPTTFNEPAGISYANGKLYVADTNAHRIRVVDLATKAVTTLQLKGVNPPPPPKDIAPKPREK
ncbi:MAG: redoxin domain-containing protein [Planctomycetia bacterium]|nr:redoxin domain-containing protein [Planctomycetia bacterium]